MQRIATSVLSADNRTVAVLEPIEEGEPAGPRDAAGAADAADGAGAA